MSADFVPNFEDAAMSLVSRGRRFDVLTLPVSLSPRRYKFITWIPARDYLKIPRDAPLMNWPDELEGLDAMIIMVDLAVFTAHGAFLDEFDTLQRFRRVCNSIWLAEKDVILVLLNIDKLSNKSPIVSAHDYKEEESQAQVADTVVNRFLSLNQDESRKIHVIFADNDDSSKNLECFEGAVQQILERKTVAAGNS
ncbi:hypothetical protein IMSHALPRED_003202 [Imshaugia aleurites]|uniref:Uncharacterized protein n=1 Tax=Imshaugia aleurites TaxID=172621 RepID=A0A8H3J7X8_9LECA|nr:hypothetical protein IMSHALPRED_003202 [Imshaugia aleurites]